MFSRKGNKSIKDSQAATGETEVGASLARMEIDGQKENLPATRRGGGFRDLSFEELQEVVAVLSRNSPMERIFGKEAGTKASTG
jgi:hypothetical protein